MMRRLTRQTIEAVVSSPSAPNSSLGLFQARQPKALRSYNPAKRFSLFIGELPCASKKVDVVDWSVRVLSHVKHSKAMNRLAVIHHAARSRQCDDDVFIRGL